MNNKLSRVCCISNTFNSILCCSQLTEVDKEVLYDQLEHIESSYRKAAARSYLLLNRRMSKSTINKTCRRSKENADGIFSYKLQPAHELSDEVKQMRINFCRTYVNR